MDLQGRSRSGADLLSLCDWIAPRLQAYSQSPLALLAFDSCHAFLPVFWACLRLGIPALPLALPTSAAEQQREAERIATAYEGALLLYDEGGAVFAHAIAQAGTSVQALSVSALCTAAIRPNLAPRDLSPEAPAYVLETSGTTGIPRAACFCGQSEPAELLDRAVLWLFPLSSSSGISGAFAQHRVTAFLPLREAIRDPDRLLALIEHHRITGFAMPPVLLSALLRHLREPSGPLERRDLSSLTRINIGSAASNPADIAALQELLADWGLASGVLHTGYGLTETGVLAWGAFEAERALALPPGETLIGPLYENVETRLAEGVLQVRKPFSFLGYLSRPCTGPDGSLALEPFRCGEDWFDTGDRARLEDAAEGEPPRLVLCGRAKDILVVNSRKVSLPAIEATLQERFAQALELVSACAMPPAAGSANERLLLVVAPAGALGRQGALATDLLQQLEQQIQSHLLEHFGVGATAIRLMEAPAFPRTSTGKIRKADLLAWAVTPEPSSPGEPPLPLAQPSALEQQLLAWIRNHAPLHQPLHRRQKIAAFGLDSLAFAGLIGDLERSHGRRCQLERCPKDPTIEDLLALFGEPVSPLPSTWHDDPRNPALVLLRHRYEQVLRAANLQSSGQPVGLGGIARLHNAEASGQPVVLLSAWPAPLIRDIAARLPQHPLYALRVGFDFATPANHQYLLFCYLEWLESCLAPLQRPYILAGNCRAALLTFELAQLLQPRQLQPQLTVLLQWDPRLASPALLPYSGAVAYQVHRDHHGRDPERSRQLLRRLHQLTPAIHQVVFSATSYNAESLYPAGRHPSDTLIRLVNQLGPASTAVGSDHPPA